MKTLAGKEGSQIVRGRAIKDNASLYTEAADALLAKAEGKPYAKAELGFPDAADGVRGVAFVEGAMRSYAAGGAWTALETL